jgi:hypothetical protein
MQCSKNPYNYANDQNTVYDANTNTMLYGINSRMKVTGVSDGTCNQINPLIYKDNYKCGLGAAGGNPCHPHNKIIESFNNLGDCNITRFVTSILLLLVLLLFIYTLYKQDIKKI